MLGMLGLFGALLAGLVADSMIGNLMGKPDTDEDDVPPGGDADPGEDGAEGNLLDWLAPEQGAAVAAHPSSDDPDYVPTSNVTPISEDTDLLLEGQGAIDVLTGAGGDDTLLGGGGDDQLSGENGNDFVQGGAGADVGYGGAGDDTLQGGAGDDLLAGNTGDDRLVGGAGSDTLLGHEGVDGLYGGAGADTLIGGGGGDRLVGGDADDWLLGGLGGDHLTGDAGSDTLDGGAGSDALNGREAVGAFPEIDFLNGGDGDDTLTIGAGDYATGGAGADWFELSDVAVGDAIANIADYNADEDTLVVVFDPALHPDPHLSLLTPDNSDDVVVLLDGVPLVMVHGAAGMTVADLLLTPAQAA